MVQYRQFAQVFMEWMGRGNTEFDIIGFEPGLAIFSLDCFIQIKSQQVAPGNENIYNSGSTMFEGLSVPLKG